MAATLTIAEVFKLVSVVITAMIYIFAAACSYFLERRSRRPPMFALIFLLFAWCLLTLGSAISGLGRLYPVLLVGAPFFSGYIGPALYIYTKQLTAPHDRVSLKWLLFGLIGTTHSCLALIIPNGLDCVIQSILYKEPYVHPLLSPIMMVHGTQLIAFTLLSTFLITRSYIKMQNPDLRRTQFWLMTICWTSIVTMVFTNILPIFKIIMTDIQPALLLLPVAIVGGLSIKAFGEETAQGRTNRIRQRKVRMDSLGRMARGMAHDLNNVLATIMGHAEIVKIKTISDTAAAAHLEQIIFGSQRAALLIDRMLTYSGKKSLVSHRINPGERIQAIFESMATLQPRSLVMNIELVEKLPHIQMDEAEFDSAIQNLLQNSLNAIQEQKGKITLRAAFEEKTQLPEDVVGNDLNGVSTLRIEVEDTGKGMSLEESSRALEPFFSTQFNGKGLGLVNVLSSVKGAGGALWFKSEQHIGTRFVLWIPVANEQLLESSISIPTPHQALHILLVEDDQNVANVLIEMLHSLGFSVEHFTCSEDVLTLVREQSLERFELGILDIKMKAIDGIELGHHLLSTDSVGNLLFISGDEPGQRIQQFGGNVEFLRKPIRLAALRDSIFKLVHT